MAKPRVRKKKENPNPNGRPRAVIDEKQLKALMRLKPSLQDAAAFFEVSDKTIETYVKERFGESFFDFREKNMVHTRLALVRNAIQQAQSGNTAMLIFCLKNLCGWKDRFDVVAAEERNVTIKLAYNAERMISDGSTTEGRDSDGVIDTTAEDIGCKS